MRRHLSKNARQRARALIWSPQFKRQWLSPGALSRRRWEINERLLAGIKRAGRDARFIFGMMGR